MRNWLALSVLAAVAFTVAIPAWGLGFGDIEVKSALGQPLVAEIQLLGVSRGERKSMQIALASPETYKRFGVYRSPTVRKLRLQVLPGDGDGRMRILLTSREPIREPFLTVLVEAHWAGNRALREYTLLLDPPDRTTDAAGVAPSEETRLTGGAVPAESRPKPRPATPTSRAAGADAVHQARAASATNPVADTKRGGSEARRYGPVGPDETLWNIAQTTRPAPDITMDQMMWAIYQANIGDFDDNINRLQQGAILQIPDPEYIRSTAPAAAAAEINAQMAAFSATIREQNAARAADPATGVDSSRQHAGGLAEGNRDDLSQASGGAAESVEAGGADNEGAGRLSTGSDTAGEVDASDGSGQLPAPTVGGAVGSGGSGAESGALAEQSTGQAAAGTDKANAAVQPASAEANRQVDRRPVREAGRGAGDPATGVLAEPTELSGTAKSRAGQAAETVSEPPGAQRHGNASPAGGDADGSSSPSTLPDPEGSSTGAESVVQQGLSLLTPRRAVLVLAIIVLLIGIVLVIRRRQYKPVPADFSGLDCDGSVGHVVTEAPEPDGEESVAAQAYSVEDVLGDADALAESGRDDEALATLALGLDAHPDNPRLLRKRLQVYWRAGNRDAFVAEARRAYPNPDAEESGWHEVAAWGRELAPEEAFFAVAGIAAADDADRDRAPTEPAAAEVSSDPLEPLPAASVLASNRASEKQHSEPEFARNTPPSAEGADARTGVSDAVASLLDPVEYGLADEGAPMFDGHAESASSDAGLSLSSFEPDALSLEGEKRSGEAVTDDGEGLDQLLGEIGTSYWTDEDAGAADVDAATATHSANAGPSPESPENGEDPDEIKVKLDLARVYLDMGEDEMAAPLLQEVRSQGDEEQRRDAGDLLARM